MRKLLSAMVVVFSMGMTGSVFAQDFQKGLKAYEAKDYATALKEWRYLAERGNAEAQDKVANMFFFGNGVTQNYNEAARLYGLAAAAGYLPAQGMLGDMYDLGLGVPQDTLEAIRRYQIAAGGGHSLSQRTLGLRYHDGRGVIQDYVFAHMWFNIAASQGNTDAAKERDEIANKMTSVDISKAQELARECVKKNYKGC